MLIRGQEVMLPTSMVGNYPNPRWWDAYFARYWSGDQRPPDSLEREALEDAVLALTHDQELAGLDIIPMGGHKPITTVTRPSITTTGAWATTSKVATWVSLSIVVCMQAR